MSKTIDMANYEEIRVQCDYWETKCADLEHELEVYKEALNLIHEELLEMNISFNMNYFIEQAKDSMKGE